MAISASLNGGGTTGSAVVISDKPTNYSGAVCRSSELLSCGKSALKIAQQQQQQQQQQSGDGASNNKNKNKNNILLCRSIELHDCDWMPDSPSLQLQEECVSLLRDMQGHVRVLEASVRRVGGTNDPTADITAATHHLEHTAKELQEVLQQYQATAAGSSSSTRHQQRQKHVALVVEWCRAAARQFSDQVQAAMKLRAQVLSAQAKRRQQFSTASAAATSNTPHKQRNLDHNKIIITSPASLHRNPLFAPKPLQSTMPKTSTTITSPLGGTHHRLSTAGAIGPMSPTENGYGGYGGGRAGTANTMLRQRKTAATASSTYNQQQQQQQQQDTSSQQSQLLLEQEQLMVQREQRQSAQRLRDARQAEQALSSIATLFGQMSSLVQQQGEVLAKVEDDVEAAACDVQAGHDEISVVYSIKKGNRALILKVFGLLIFLICVLRFYKK